MEDATGKIGGKWFFILGGFNVHVQRAKFITQIAFDEEAAELQVRTSR